MGTIVSNFFIALDGVVESPNKWQFPYFDDAMGQIITEVMTTSTAYLMGRRLYDEWSAHWPEQGRDDPFAAFINRVPKHVLSTTLTDPTWQNTTVISGDVAAGVASLKQRTDGVIGMSGSATTARWLLANGLLDELSLLVHPVAVGSGHRLFEDSATQPFTLLSCAPLGTGVLHLRYAPAA